jgi:hypothetical protein
MAESAAGRQRYASLRSEKSVGQLHGGTMDKIKAIVGLLAFLILSFDYSFADQVTNIQVRQIFSEGDAQAGFYLVQELKQCKWSILYIDLSKESGRTQLDLLLWAKQERWKLVRVDYNKQPDGICRLTGLHID